MEQIKDVVASATFWAAVGAIAAVITLLVVIAPKLKVPVRYVLYFIEHKFLRPFQLPWSKLKSVSWRLYLRACSKARIHDKEALLIHLCELRQRAINLELGSELVEEDRDNEEAQEELRRVKLVSGGEKISYEKLISYLYPEEYSVESWQCRGGSAYGVRLRWKVGDDGRGQLVSARNS